MGLKKIYKDVANDITAIHAAAASSEVMRIFKAPKSFCTNSDADTDILARADNLVDKCFAAKGPIRTTIAVANGIVGGVGGAGLTFLMAINDLPVTPNALNDNSESHDIKIFSVIGSLITCSLTISAASRVRAQRIEKGENPHTLRLMGVAVAEGLALGVAPAITLTAWANARFTGQYIGGPAQIFYNYAKSKIQPAPSA